MKTKIARITKTALFALVSIVTSIAVMGAASASYLNAHQPKVPAKLR